MQRLPRHIGASRAKELIFTGRKVPGHEAAQLGLAEYVVSDNEVCGGAHQGGRHAVGGMRDVFQ